MGCFATPTHACMHARTPPRPAPPRTTPPAAHCRAGEFNADFLLRELPGILGIEQKRVRMLLKELVRAASGLGGARAQRCGCAAADAVRSDPGCGPDPRRGHPAAVAPRAALHLPDRSPPTSLQVGARKRMTLVQAVSQFRQKRPGDAAVSLNNFVSASRAQPDEGPLQWNDREELKDLYSVYCAKVRARARQLRGNARPPPPSPWLTTIHT